jgi:hypothetical protein
MMPLNSSGQSSNELKLEFLTTHDNDALIPYIQADKDYSFGLFEEVRFKGDSSRSLFFKSKVRSVLYSFKAGIMGFTPDHELEGFDPDNFTGRPFAGWLFIEHSQYFVFDRSYARFGVQGGVIGPHAYAGNFQNWFHREFNTGPHVPGWEHQIPSHFGLNLQGDYSRVYARKGSFMLYSDHKASLGSVFSFLEPSVALRLGRYTSLNNFSRLTDGRLSSGKKASWFFDLRGGVTYKIYDATLQGNPFTNDDFFSSQNVNNLALIGSFKCSYVTKNLSISMQNHFRSADLSSSKRFNYGSLVIAFLI